MLFEPYNLQDILFMGFYGSRIPHWYSYSGISLVSQAVKNLPAMQETWVRSLSWKDPLELGMTTYSSILAWRIPWTGKSGAHGVAKSWTRLTEQYTHTHTHTHSYSDGLPLHHGTRVTARNYTALHMFLNLVKIVRIILVLL